jgi:hypothetical protein
MKMLVGQALGLRRALSPPIYSSLATPHEADRGLAAAEAAAPLGRPERPPQATGLPHLGMAI